MLYAPTQFSMHTPMGVLPEVQLLSIACMQPLLVPMDGLPASTLLDMQPGGMRILRICAEPCASSAMEH